MQNKKNISLKTVFLILLLLFILSIIPLYYIGIFAHPSADDYSYGIKTSRVWNETGSFFQVLNAASEKTIDKYYNWQGNFSAVFLMYLQPGIFGEEYYFLTPFLLLTSFILCSFFFYYTCFRKVLKSDGVLAGIGSLLIVSFALQFTHVPSDSFYWYNGAIYYTFFNSLTLLLYSFIIKLYYENRTHLQVVYFLIGFFLSFVVGGSNFSTALLNAVLLFFTLCYCIYRKNSLWKYYLPVFLVGFSSLIISILGPGNSLRQSTIGETHGILPSILLSFIYGGYTIVNATVVPLVLFWCLLVPVFWKIIDYTSWEFKHPFFLLGLSFCIYSAQITPVIFAQGIRIPYRIMNIVYFNYFPFIGINLYYILGFMKKRHQLPSLSRTKPFSVVHYYVVLCLSLIIFTLGSVRIYESSDGKVRLSNLPFTASAVYSLITGEAKEYDREEKERIVYMKSTAARDITLEPLTHQPYVLFHSDITSDSNFWKNRHYAEYYGKRTVRIKESAED